MGSGASHRSWHRLYHLTSNEAYENSEVFQQIFPVWSIAVTHNQKQLASATGNHMINLWCLVTHKLLVSLPGHGDTIWKLSYSPDDCVLASCSADGTVRLWEVDSGILISILPRMHANWVRTLQWAPDGNRLATAGTDTRILVWSTAKVTDRSRRCSNYAAESNNPDARKRYFAEKELREGPRQEEIDHELEQPLVWWQAHEKSVTGISFAPQDPNMLASVGADGTLCVWDTTEGALDVRLMGHIGTITCVAVSPRYNDLIASGGEDHTVRLWDLKDIEPGCMNAKASREKAIGHNLPHFTLKGHEAGVMAVTFMGDGHLLASAAKDCEIRVWNPSKKGPTLHHKILAHEAWVTDLCFTLDQHQLFSGSTDGLIFAWQVPHKYHISKKKRKHKSHADQYAPSTDVAH
jgi:WD40 repeat protein